MKNREIIAGEILKWCFEHDGTDAACGVSVIEVMSMISGFLIQCPWCGAEAWVNIDCPICWTMSSLQKGELP